MYKKRLKIPKRLSELLNQRSTDNTTDKGEQDKMANNDIESKTLHRQLKIGHREHYGFHSFPVVD